MGKDLSLATLPSMSLNKYNHMVTNKELVVHTLQNTGEKRQAHPKPPLVSLDSAPLDKSCGGGAGRIKTRTKTQMTEKLSEAEAVSFAV